MKAVILALVLTSAATTGALAQRYRGPALPPGPAVPYGLTADEARDYQRDQLDRRQEMERNALRAHQKAERRLLGLDDD